MPELHGLRCAKYIRCSHDDQVLHGDTLEAQDAILDDFILRNHLVLVDTFVDEALTARNLSPGGCADLLALTYFFYFYRAHSGGQDAGEP